MFLLWSEWDIDESCLAFVSKESAVRWLSSNLHVHDMARDDKQTVDEFIKTCFEDGLFGLKPLEIVQ